MKNNKKNEKELIFKFLLTPVCKIKLDFSFKIKK